MMPTCLLLEEMLGLRPLGIDMPFMTLIKTHFYRPFLRVPVDYLVQAPEDKDLYHELRRAQLE